MKFKFVIIFIFLTFLISCQKKSALDKSFNCNSSIASLKTKVIKDVKKNFRLHIPTNWKTKLYYDEFQSDIFSADTTKQLTQTYILDASWKMGNLEFNSEFEQKIKENTQFEILNSKYEKFKGKNAYWYLSKGKNKGFDYQILKIFIKTGVDSYLEIYTEVYGDKNIKDRLCESIALINTIEFI